jgi:hypothetical protein
MWTTRATWPFSDRKVPGWVQNASHRPARHHDHALLPQILERRRATQFPIRYPGLFRGDTSDHPNAAFAGRSQGFMNPQHDEQGSASRKTSTGRAGWCFGKWARI